MTRRKKDALGKRSLVWSHVSIGRDLVPSNPATAVALRPFTRMLSASASWPRCVADHTEIGTALQPGRSRRCKEPYGRLPTDCRR